MTLHNQNQDWITQGIHQAVMNKFWILLNGYPVKLVHYNKIDTKLYFIMIIFYLLNFQPSFAE